MNPELITIGEIINTQGHRGAVRVLPLTDFPERFLELREVVLTQGQQHRLARVQHVAYHGRFIVLRLQEVEDMNAAEKLRGALLQVPRDRVVALPEGHWYIFELIGLKVLTIDGEELGEMVDVLQTGANDVYVVRDVKGQELLIPALKEVVREINPAAGCMVVNLPEGLRQ